MKNFICKNTFKNKQKNQCFSQSQLVDHQDINKKNSEV